MKKSKFIQLVIVGAALASASCQRQQVYSSNKNMSPILPPDSTNMRPDSTFYPADTLGVYQGYYPYYYQYPYNQFYLNLQPYWFYGRHHHHHRFRNAYYYGRGGYHHMHTASIAHSHGATGHASGHFGGHVSHGGFGHSGGHGFGGHS